MGRRIGLLTGTFDPVHLGHVAMARAAMKSASLDEVWFLVNPLPGHKVGVVSYPDRLALVKRVVATEPFMHAYDGHLAGKSHTIDVFLTMISEHPQDSFVFIVGVDVLRVMREWEGYERVLDQARFVVAKRKGVEVPELDPHLRVEWFEFTEHAGASSRDIRAMLAAGERPDDLDAAAYDYIQARGLYGVSSH